MKKNTHFTVYNDYVPLYDKCKFILDSVWSVDRDKEYVATERDTSCASNTFCFIRTLNGSGEITLKNKILRVKKEDLLLVRYSDVLSYRPKTATWEYRWVNFKIEGDVVPFFRLNKVYKVAFEDNEIEEFDKMFKIMQVYNELNIRIVHSMFEIRFFSWIKIITKNVDRAVKFSNEIEEILVFLSKTRNENVSIEKLASQCLLSVRRFRDVFKKEVGMSPKQYVKKKRLEEVAYLLLTTNNSLESIAEELQYSSSFYMMTEFKKQYGITPKQYRKKGKIIE